MEQQLARLLLLCYWAAVLVTEGSTIAAANQPNKSYVVLYGYDLKMETISEWRIGRFFTLSGTVLFRLASNFEKITKIAVWKDDRCEGLVCLSPSCTVRHITEFDVKKGLEQGILKLLNLLIYRGNKKDMDFEFIIKLSLAKVNLEQLIASDTDIAFDQWYFSVYAPLESLFQEDGINNLGIKWGKNELHEIFKRIDDLMEAADAKIIEYQLSKLSQSMPDDDSSRTALTEQWTLETMREMAGKSITSYLSSEQRSKADTFEDFAHNFWQTSDFIRHWNDDLENSLKGGSAGFFFLLVNKGLLPDLERLIIKKPERKKHLRETRLIYAGMERALTNLQSYLPKDGSTITPPGLDQWNREIYANLYPLFKHRQVIVGNG